MSNPQNEIKTKLYKINHYTISPSVHSRPDDVIFDQNDDVVIVENHS